jgi:hypothetical protein
LLDARSTQTPLQTVCPARHIITHAPIMQAWPAGHALPHAPQFALFVLVLMHVPLQFVVPDGQLHAPAPQVIPPVQA